MKMKLRLVTAAKMDGEEKPGVISLAGSRAWRGDKKPCVNHGQHGEVLDGARV